MLAGVLCGVFVGFLDRINNKGVLALARLCTSSMLWIDLPHNNLAASLALFRAGINHIETATKIFGRDGDLSLALLY